MFDRNNHKPKTITDMVIPNPKTRERLEDYESSRRQGNVLLHGPKGTGKTCAAEIISKAREKQNDNSILESEDFRAFEGATITEKEILSLPDEWEWRRQCGMKPPTIVINEIDKLSSAMLEKLKATMDQNEGKGQIIATTNNRHKLPPALDDRFRALEMPALSVDDFVAPVMGMVEKEGFSVTEAEVKAVLATSTGSWRDALDAAEEITLRKSKAQPKP
jgi:replication-associated recombination protein RarA